MDIPVEVSGYDSSVRQIMRVEDVTLGTAQQGFIARYRGQIINPDTEAAYEQLSNALKPHHLTPLFRWDEKRHSILIIEGLPKPTPDNTRTNLIMFLLTLVSLLVTGGFLAFGTTIPEGFGAIVLGIITQGWPFALSMIAILGSHEMGHYLMGRHHKVHVTLPYFIPLPYPISPFGTMGAFINMKEIPRNRRQLLDIGAAGPLAGLIVAIPVILIGLALSPVRPLPSAEQICPPGTMVEMFAPLPTDCEPASSLEGNSILYLLLKYISKGEMLPAPAAYTEAPALHWLTYIFTGHPLPFGGRDVTLHPVAWAGWAGLLVTAMNLIPAGQLDGGHVLFVLLGGKRTRKTVPIILILLGLLGFVWPGWWLWAVLIFFLGRAHAEPLDQITPLDGKRKALAVLMVVVFLLVFVPVPLMIMQ